MPVRTRHLASAAAAAALALTALTSCATGPSQGVPEAAGPLPDIVAGTAQLDPEHEDVLMPLGRFQLQPDEYALMRKASNALVERCVRAAGFDVGFPHEDMEYLTVTHFSFGVWTNGRAERYAYGSPPSSGEGQAFETALSAGGPDLLDSVQSCNEQEETRALNDGMEPEGVASRADSESWVQMEHDPRSAPIIGAHQACMAGHGFQIGDDWAVEGYGAMSADQKIATALVDVDCKRSSTFVQGLADIAAAYQQQYISHNEARLASEKQQLDALLVRAKQILGGDA